MKKIIITGGAGFIGTNLCYSALKKGYHVVIFDNLSRHGVKHNLHQLQKHKNVEFIKGDVSDAPAVLDLIKQHSNSSALFHLAGQVAVTTSIDNPRHDFENNALGSFNILEAARTKRCRMPLLYSSTNKVYGELNNLPITERASRYEFKNQPDGISEDQQLEFHSPYGCSKGIGDQYFMDYARIYSLNTIVFRQSCIYGPHQLGVEDQGWLAWFTLATLNNIPLTIYGNGKQVRDVLHVNDLINAYWLAIENIKTTSGQTYNIGGGKWQLSLHELLSMLKTQLNKEIPISYKESRSGDQLIYTSNTSKAKKDFGWQPTISPNKGIQNLISWIRNNQSIFLKAGILNENIFHSRPNQRLVSEKRVPAV